MFNLLIGFSDEDIKNRTITVREAIRGVIFKDNKLLMIKTNRGDYKLPGGGKKKSESRIEALVREVKEETGYEVKKVGRQIGTIIQRQQDLYNKDAIFEMRSFYYLCRVSDVKSSQELDPMELEQEFRPEWIDIDEAIKNNEDILNSKSNDINAWVAREIMALKEIKNMLAEGTINM